MPAGCKKIADALKIVDNESDAYDRDDVALTRVVADAQLDVAVLKAHTALHLRCRGRSAARPRCASATWSRCAASRSARSRRPTSARSSRAYDHDDYNEWDHDDFVVDALLSSGNSGSPVLAVSCKTGEFELVGVYHAGYSRGLSALNVVVGIDQVRDLMTTLKRSPKTHAPARLGARRASDGSCCRASARPPSPFFPFGTADRRRCGRAPTAPCSSRCSRATSRSRRTPSW